MKPNARVTELENILLKAKQAYYHGDSPILSDQEYDAREDELRSLAPKSPVLAMVGAPVPADSILAKAQHTMPMGSQNKVNSLAELETWYTTINRQTAEIDTRPALHASLKGDGASAAAYYSDGSLVQAITRGDGFEGEDISANAAKFRGLPLRAHDSDGRGFTGAVRFEVILLVSDWSAIDPEQSKNPRNRGNGIMGRKNGAEAERLTAFAFDIDDRTPEAPPLETETAKVERLQTLGFNVIPNRLCPSLEAAAAYFEHVTATRQKLPMWIDGVVFKVEDLALQRALGVVANRPKGQVAWKFDSQGAETELLDYSVSVGHTGALIPTAHLAPVEIGGTTVQNALLNNWDEIERLNVAVGDRVWLIKANDIIPKITHVVVRPESRRPIAIPVLCPACGGDVRRRVNTGGDAGVVLECANDDCDAKSLGKIKRWVKALDIQGIGDVVLRALVSELQVEDAADLYALEHRKDALASLTINVDADLHLGEKRATSILQNLEARKQLTLVELLGSLGLDRLGKRRVEMMIQAARGELDTLEQWQEGKLRDTDFSARVGVPNLGMLIQDALDQQAPLIAKLLERGVTITGPGAAAAAAETTSQPTLCISGRLPSGKKKKDYEEPLAAAGIKLVDKVAEGLTYLVIADPSSESAKTKKAKKLGVRLLSELELLEVLSGEAPAQR